MQLCYHHMPRKTISEKKKASHSFCPQAKKFSHTAAKRCGRILCVRNWKGSVVNLLDLKTAA